MQGITRDDSSAFLSIDEMIAACLELKEKVDAPPVTDFHCVKIPREQVPDVIKVKRPDKSVPAPDGLPCIDIAGDLYVMSPGFYSSMRRFRFNINEMNVCQFGQSGLSDITGRGLY